MTRRNRMLLGLLGVAAAGAGIAYLMTTERGGRIRKNVKTKAQGLMNGLKSLRHKKNLSSDSVGKPEYANVPAY